MKTRFPIWPCVLALAACEGSGSGLSGRPITPAEIRQIAQHHVRDDASGVLGAIRSLEGTPVAEALDLDLGFEPGEIGETTSQIAAEMADRLFDESTIVELETDRVVYGVNPARVCRDGSGVDETCAAIFRDVPVRLVVTSPAVDAIDVAFEVGSGPSRPLTIGFAPATVRVDLELS